MCTDTYENYSIDSVQSAAGQVSIIQQTNLVIYRYSAVTTERLSEAVAMFVIYCLDFKLPFRISQTVSSEGDILRTGRFEHQFAALDQEVRSASCAYLDSFTGRTHYNGCDGCTIKLHL